MDASDPAQHELSLDPEDWRALRALGNRSRRADFEILVREVIKLGKQIINE
jgi:hypothetical protein